MSTSRSSAPAPSVRRAAALALLLAASAALAGPEGRYRLTGMPEAAAQLELLPDHRFRYALSYGALDEIAEGRWTATPDGVTLTTEPTPVPPAFTLKAAARAPDMPLRVRVVGPNGRGVALIDVTVGFASGEPATGYTQDYGWTLRDDAGRAPRWVELALPMYGIGPQRFAVDAAKANDLEFLLTPNDLGVADFRALPLRAEAGALVMLRGGAALRFARVEGD